MQRAKRSLSRSSDEEDNLLSESMNRMALDPRKRVATEEGIFDNDTRNDIENADRIRLGWLRASIHAQCGLKPNAHNPMAIMSAYQSPCTLEIQPAYAHTRMPEGFRMYFQMAPDMDALYNFYALYLCMGRGYPTRLHTRFATVPHAAEACVELFCAMAEDLSPELDADSMLG